MDPEIIQIIEMFIVAIAAVIAYIQNLKKGQAQADTDLTAAMRRLAMGRSR